MPATGYGKHLRQMFLQNQAKKNALKKSPQKKHTPSAKFNMTKKVKAMQSGRRGK